MGNLVGFLKDVPRPAMNYAAEPVILVVGNDTEYKRRVAYALAEARGAPKDEVTKAGVRIFTRESAPAEPVVIDTVPLKTVKDWSRTTTARVWISQNSLRRLGGKLVFVVCVVTSSDQKDEIYQEPCFESNRYSWLHLFSFVCEHQKQKIIMLVNSEDSTDEAFRRLPQLKEILKRDGFGDNMTKFFNFQRGELTPTVGSILQHIVYRGEADDETTARAGPFFLREVAASASDIDRFGSWGPENVIVFGRAGSGKSTLAQMLTMGRLDPLSRKFSTSSGVRGETKAVKNGQGRGWRVVDTPGLGESINDPKSTVSTEKAGRLIKKYVLLREGTYSHFIYVWKRGRVDDLDERLWEVFVKMFGVEMIGSHMTVVVTEADQEWLDKNISDLRNSFEGCESFVPAEFPLLYAEDDYYAEKEILELRLGSLKALEDELASRCRVDICCKLGLWSLSTQRSLAIRSADEVPNARPHIRQSPAVGPSAGQYYPSDYVTGRFLIRMKSYKSCFGATLKPKSKT